MVVNLLERVLFIGKIKKPIRRKKPELLRGGQPFGKGTFHWKNQENQEEEKRKKNINYCVVVNLLERGLFIGKIKKPKKKKKEL